MVRGDSPIKKIIINLQTTTALSMEAFIATAIEGTADLGKYDSTWLANLVRGCYRHDIGSMSRVRDADDDNGAERLGRWFLTLCFVHTDRLEPHQGLLVVRRALLTCAFLGGHRHDPVSTRSPLHVGQGAKSASRS